MTTRIQGFCPMGCGETLMLGAEGYATCGHLDCPAPAAVSDILADREVEHIVVFEEETFSIQHPLRERLNGELFDCGLHTYISALDGPPARVGRYRAFAPYVGDGPDGRWMFVPIVAARSLEEIDDVLGIERDGD